MKTKVKAKSTKKVAMPKYIVTTFIDKKEKRKFRIIEKIVPEQIVYEAINTWYYSTNKEYKDFPWYKDLKIKKINTELQRLRILTMIHMIRIKIFLIEAEKGQNYKTLHITTPYSKLGISRSSNYEFRYSNNHNLKFQTPNNLFNIRNLELQTSYLSFTCFIFK